MRREHTWADKLALALAILFLGAFQSACDADPSMESDAAETMEAAAEGMDDEHASDGGQPHWTYVGETGAERWGELDASFAVCSEGAQQSPIDLAGTVAAEPVDLDIQWQPTAAEVLDNGHTIQVNMAVGSSITLGGRQFSLLQFHFHLPSEHTVEGDALPMEAHFVHQAEAGDLAVIGVFMDAGESHPVIDDVWNAAPEAHAPAAALAELDPQTLLPDEASLFRYAGSLTTPPCSEVVSWMVMTESIQVSQAQVDAFAERHPMNARPVQDLNRRFVLLR